MPNPGDGNGPKRLALIADICGACSTIGLILLWILKSQRILDIEDVKEPLVIAVVAAFITGVILVGQGISRYFSFFATFRSRSPWWDLVLGIALLSIAFGGWQAI
jgi:hypothetical protein